MKAPSSLACLLALAWLPGLPVNARAATVVVTNLAASGPGTLRDAIAFANTNSGADVITFDAALSGQTNILTSGQLTISDALTIDASVLPAGFKISGNTNSRVFELVATAVVTLKSLTIQDGHAPSGTGGAGIRVNQGANLTLTNCTLSGNSTDSDGGGIWTFGGTLAITGCRFSGNSAVSLGGAIHSYNCSVRLTNCTLSGNSASYGGGIFDNKYGSLTIDSSTVSNNSATEWGGGVYNYISAFVLNNSTVAGNSANGTKGGGGIYNTGALLTITNCTLSSNSAAYGGGIYLDNSLDVSINGSTVSSNSASTSGGGVYAYGSSDSFTLNNSTIAGNSANGADGGGIANVDASLTINNSTLSGNYALAATGGGIYFSADDPSYTCSVTNTIVAGNSAFNSSNLYTIGSGSFAGANNLTNGDPLLSPLDNYGGPTATMRPRLGSPAIDAGMDSITNLLATDQRGLPRCFGAHVDIGAVEAQVTVVSNLNDSGAGSLRAAIAAPRELVGFAANLSGGTLTLTSSQIAIATNVAIDASAMAAGLTISGNHSSRIFEVNSGATVTLDSLSLLNGNAGTGGGILVDGGGTLTLTGCLLSSNAAAYGGGIENLGALTLRGSTVAANSATTNSGGIENRGTATLRDSTVVGNHANNNSGGIENDDGPLALTACYIRSNSASFGGGIASFFSNATVVITGSTFSGNVATNNGGGIENAYGSTLTLNNSTLSGNSAGGGGGIFLYLASLTANNSTIATNSASASAGGIYNFGALFLTNTIVAGNGAGSSPNIYTDSSGSFSGASNLTNGTPLLAPLGNHGGPTPTMPPLHGSPAIDAGSDSVTNFLATDQRGFPRKSGAHVDIGAVEAQAVNPANAPVLTKPVMQTNGAVLVGIASSPNADFTVLASTNVALPLAQWSPLGAAMQYQPGQFQFTDPNAANYSRRFYRVTSP